MGKNDTYWNGLEQYNANPDFQKGQKDEFLEDLPLEETFSEENLGLNTNRRDFLKIFGFGLTAAALAACDKPIRKAIPYVVKPENVTPGVPSWYASTCGGCASGCGVLVKSREGRPIKIEGNPEHMLNKGGVCAIGQATVLDLYDNSRIMKSKGSEGTLTWEAVDQTLGSVFNSSSRVAVVSNTITSPSGRGVISKFLGQFSNGRHIQYDPVSYHALAAVHSSGGDMMTIPGYHFDKAEVIVSFDADFLGGWLSGPEFTKGWSKMRTLDPDHPKMSQHFHFESRMSLTGSNADRRVPMKPSQMAGALAQLYNEIVGGGPKGYGGPGNIIKQAAKALKAAKGKSIVVCGANDMHMQSVTKAINEALRNYGSTLNMDNPSYQAQGNDKAMMDFAKNAGSYDAVIFIDDVNPVYDFAGSEELVKNLAKVQTIFLGTKESETSKICKYVLAQNHALESWGDAQPRKNYLSIQQPLVRPLYETRQWQECLLKWSGNNKGFYAFVKETWKSVHTGGGDYKSFWESTVRDGFVEVGAVSAAVAVEMHGSGGYAEAHEGAEDHGEGHDGAPTEGDDHAEMEEMVSESAAISDVSASVAALVQAFNKAASGFELVLYQTSNLGTGRAANNPWLQELPNPITKVTWDNYITVPYSYAMEQGLKDGDVLSLSSGGKSVKAPVVIQPGQANGSVTLSVGYGRDKSVGKVGGDLGVNAYPMVGSDGTNFSYHGAEASLSKTDDNVDLAKTQTFIGYELDDQRELIEDRVSDYIVKETTLGKYNENRASGNKRASSHHMISLWDVHDKKGHHWAMAIDLNKCTGCGSCIVSCNAENNIPVVGKAEVLGRREMHWMRIDRYYKGDPGDQEGNLETLHQPMMCQHCDNAPCETVCPVLATVHSDEGLNQQVYNRCIGTRYCANNCPYKVRRFNWFSYYWNDDFKDVNFMARERVGRLVLNPDVTVRARGVMEKCSFCVQRIQEKKLKAKTEMRKPMDGEIKTACQQSCPSDAIVFGDLNDEQSEIYKLYRFNMRGYHALEEVKTLPSVLYMTKVRNKDGMNKVAHEGDHA